MADPTKCWNEHPRAMMVFCRQRKGHSGDHIGGSGVIRWTNQMQPQDEPVFPSEAGGDQ